MRWSAYIILACYFVLLTAMLRWLGVGRRSRRISRIRFASSVLFLTITFLVLGFWWRIPIGVQTAVDSAASPASPSSVGSVDCAALEQSLPSIARVSGQQLSISEQGEVTMGADMWASMNREQQDMMMQLATRARTCLGGPEAAGPVVIRDPETGAILDQGN